MATFVLVHGAWGGGWQWQGVGRLLEAEGHQVLRPSLTGMGDRAHLIGPDVGLSTHIDDITRLIQWEDVQDVVLAGHSYAGMVLSGVCARMPERLAHLVYIDAFLPRAGQSVLDIAPSLAERLAEPRPDDPHGYPPTSKQPLIEVGYTTAEEVAWVESRATSTPVMAFREELVAAPEPGAVPGTYLWCERNVVHAATARLAGAEGLRVVTVEDATHWQPLRIAGPTAEILSAVAALSDVDGGT